ncbi:septum formation initiator family protein [Helcococcus bovis]|uniref:Septum formation initiator family protein n=1 Tax=Helcococcus bovis TaxID=3153252 RepID=A0ABW9F6E6_9FIRM
MENLRELKVNNLNPSIKKSRIRARRKTRINFQTLRYNMIYVNIIAIVILFFTLLVGYSEMVHISSNNLVMQGQLDVLEVDQNSLKNIATPLQNEKRIEAIAKSRLDMVYPNRENIVKVDNIKNERQLALSDFETKNNSNNKSSSVLSIITNLFR